MPQKDKGKLERSHLRLVIESVDVVRPKADDGVQFSLFPESDSSVMSFFHTAFLKKIP